jgi:hypothetical protein
MHPDDQLWLETVMKDIRDDPTRMNEIMVSLRTFIDKDVVTEGECNALEVDLDELRDIVEQIDMAQVITAVFYCAMYVFMFLCLISSDPCEVSRSRFTTKSSRDRETLSYFAGYGFRGNCDSVSE